MTYTVRTDPAAMQPYRTSFRVGVSDGDRVVRPAIDEGGDTTPPAPLPPGDIDVLWGAGPPPDPTDPTCEPYESYVDLTTGDVYVRS